MAGCRSITARSWHRKLQEEFGYKNPMQVPRLEKIVINMGVGRGGSGCEEADQCGRPS